MQALKGLVIGLGLTIVLVMGVLVWGLFKKSEDPDFKMFTFSDSTAKKAPSATTGAPPLPQEVIPSWGSVSLNLPAGCGLHDMATGGGRLYVRTGSDGGALAGCNRVVVIDPATGRILGTVTETP